MGRWNLKVVGGLVVVTVAAILLVFFYRRQGKPRPRNRNGGGWVNASSTNECSAAMSHISSDLLPDRYARRGLSGENQLALLRENVTSTTSSSQCARRMQGLQSSSQKLDSASQGHI